MADYNFIRFFVVLTEKEKGYGAISASGAKLIPGGYCKVESLNGQSVFSTSLRGAQRGKDFTVYAAMGDDCAACMGTITAGEDGTAYMMFKTEANDVFGSGKDIRTVKGIFVTDDEKVVLEGYVNKNISKEEKNKLIRSLAKKEEEPILPEILSINDAQDQEDKNSESEIAAEELFASEGDADNNEDLTMQSLNDSENDTLQASESVNQSDSPKQDNPLEPYMQTLAKLYAGLTGNGNFTMEKETSSQENASNCNYWDLVKDYYGELFEKGECIAPFTLSKNNSKWILVNPYNGQTGNCGGNIVGLVYENGAVKYVVNGIPMMPWGGAVAPTGSMIWMPASPNPYGVMGYWLTFIDAATGKLCPAAVAL